jgi:hypothetical protein
MAETTMHVPRAGQPGPAAARTHLCVVRPGPVHAWTTYVRRWIERLFDDGDVCMAWHGMAWPWPGAYP